MISFSPRNDRFLRMCRSLCSYEACSSLSARLDSIMWKSGLPGCTNALISSIKAGSICLCLRFGSDAGNGGKYVAGGLVDEGLK